MRMGVCGWVHEAGSCACANASANTHTNTTGNTAANAAIVLRFTVSPIEKESVENVQPRQQLSGDRDSLAEGGLEAVRRELQGEVVRVVGLLHPADVPVSRGLFANAAACAGLRGQPPAWRF